MIWQFESVHRNSPLSINKSGEETLFRWGGVWCHPGQRTVTAPLHWLMLLITSTHIHTHTHTHRQLQSGLLPVNRSQCVHISVPSAQAFPVWPWNQALTHHRCHFTHIHTHSLFPRFNEKTFYITCTRTPELIQLFARVLTNVQIEREAWRKQLQWSIMKK